MNHVEQHELIYVLAHPSENKYVEYKGWLDLTEDRGRAKLAKHAIAIANSGGGKIVLGMTEPKNAEESWISEARPDVVSPYTDDMVSSAIHKYADPMPECKLEYANHPTSGVSHAIVIVFGGLTEPVIAKRGYPKELIQHRCYVRKLGPARSEEPKSALEWRELLDRCVKANHISLVDAVRGIFDGRLVTAPAVPSSEEILLDFVQESRDCWEKLVSDLPQDDLARLSYGKFEFSFSLTSFSAFTSMKDLHDYMVRARDSRISKYEPFWYGVQDAHTPKFSQTTLEAWMGNPDGRVSSFLHALDCSYWRATQDGQFFHIEGMYEDIGLKNMTPGTRFERGYAIRRIGAFLMYISQLADLLNSDSEVLVFGQFSGMQNRKLFIEKDFWNRTVKNISLDDTASFGPISIEVSRLQNNLEEAVRNLLQDVYERFDYFKLKTDLVAAEIEILRTRGY